MDATKNKRARGPLLDQLAIHACPSALRPGPQACGLLVLRPLRRAIRPNPASQVEFELENLASMR